MKIKVKKEMKFLALLAAVISMTAGCGNNSSSSERTESNTTTETTITEITVTAQITTTQTVNTESTECTEAETTQEVSGYTERQIVEAICVEFLGGMHEPYTVLGENSELIEYENDADYLIHKAETIEERYLGKISGEEDAIEKARSVWKEILDPKFIERVESEYVDVDGVKMKFERRNPPYIAEYYDEYDVWYVVPTSPSGTREDGVGIDVIWDFPPYLLIRGEDGMILGSFS
jgi:lipoprotein